MNKTETKKKYRNNYVFADNSKYIAEELYKPTEYEIKVFNADKEQYEYKKVVSNLILELENENERIKDILIERNIE